MSSRAIEAARAFVRIYADDSALKKTLSGMNAQLIAASRDFSGIGLASGAGAASLTALGAAAVMVGANAERTAVSFEVMLGSAAKAKTMLDEIYNLGANSPFGAADFMQAGQTLLNFGASAESVLPTMSMLGDVANGDSEKLQRLTMVYGQMSAAGRLMGQDLNQMINAGFNPLQQISEKTGETMIELKKRMEAGGISSSEVADAFKAATSAGGRFHGMTDRIAKTTIGKWMTLKDEIMMLSISMSGHLLPAVNAVLGIARGLVATFSGWGKGLVYAGVAAAAFLGTIAALSAALMTYVKVQIIAKSFSGPAGWAMVAASAAVATASVAALSLATKDLTTQTATTHPPMKTTAKDLADIAIEAPAAADGLNSVADAAQHAQDVIDGLQDPMDKVVDAANKFEAALAKAGKHGMVMQGENPLVAAFIESESGFASMLKDINREIEVLGGTATETGQKLADMLKAGVSPERVEELRAAIQKKEELKAREENAKYWKERQDDLQAQADEVRESLMTVQDAFAKEKQRLGTLVSSGLLTQEEADQSLGKNPEFVKVMKGVDPEAISAATRGNTAASQDLRSVAGAAQLTSLFNNQQSVQDKQLSVLQETRENIKRMRQLAEQKQEFKKV
jgi:tape measure domain-containing protein